MGAFLIFATWGWSDFWKWLGGGSSGSGSEGGATAVPELDANQLGVALVLLVGGMLIIQGRRRLAHRP